LGGDDPRSKGFLPACRLGRIGTVERCPHDCGEGHSCQDPPPNKPPTCAGTAPHVPRAFLKKALWTGSPAMLRRFVFPFYYVADGAISIALHCECRGRAAAIPPAA